MVGILHEHGYLHVVLNFTNMGYMVGGEIHEGREGQGKATFTKVTVHACLGNFTN